MKPQSFILTSIIFSFFIINAYAQEITYENGKCVIHEGDKVSVVTVDFYKCNDNETKKTLQINCTEEIDKLYNMDNFNWNEKEWKNPQAFQDYLDKAFNNPINPEFKKKCLKEFTQRNDMIYDAEKDHITWKRVCDTFHPCKSH